MSSIPGRSLEDYIAWNYNIVVIGEDENNVSLGLAEAIGTFKPRSRLTKGQFKVILDHFETKRDEIEEGLLDFDEEDHGSWRDYCSFPMQRGFTDEEVRKIDEQVFNYLKTL